MIKKSSPSVQFPWYSILKALWNRKWLITGVWAVVSAGVVVLVWCLPPVYTSEAVVLVESQRIPEKFVSATVNEDLEDQLSNLTEEVLSSSRLTELIQKFHLYENERRHHSPEEVIRIMRNDIKIVLQRNGPPGRPGSFHISFRASRPGVAADITNLMASFFINENFRSRQVEAAGTSEFLDNRLADSKVELERQEQRLSAYKLEHIGELPQQENAILTTSSQLSGRLNSVQNDISRAQENKALLESTLAQVQSSEVALENASRPESVSASGDPGTPLSDPHAEVKRLEALVASLRLRYKDDHPDVKLALADLAHAKDVALANDAEADTEKQARPKPSAPDRPKKTAALSPGMIALQERITNIRGQITMESQEITRLEHERDQLTHNLSESSNKLDRLPIREQELARITRDYEITKADYQSLLSKKLAANVAADMERNEKSERFVMLDKANVPQKPSSPKRGLWDTAGCFGGLIFSLALGLVLEYRKGRLLGEWELPKNVTILSRIPVLQKTAGRDIPDQGSGTQDSPDFGGGASPVLRGAHLPQRVGTLAFPFTGDNGMAMDQYRILRTRVTQSSRAPKVIAISSPGIGDGKSTTALNLAGALTLKPDVDVLLVDADFRRSSLSKTLGVRPTPGLADVLAGTCTLNQALIRFAELPRFHFLAAGEMGGRGTDLLDSPAWRSVCEVFRQRFGFTVVDSAPAGPLADIDLIQEACDGIVLVARLDHSVRKNLLQSLETPKLLGLVLNCYVNWLTWRNHDYYRQLSATVIPSDHRNGTGSGHGVGPSKSALLRSTNGDSVANGHGHSEENLSKTAGTTD